MREGTGCSPPRRRIPAPTSRGSGHETFESHVPSHPSDRLGEQASGAPVGARSYVPWPQVGVIASTWNTSQGRRSTASPHRSHLLPAATNGSPGRRTGSPGAPGPTQHRGGASALRSRCPGKAGPPAQGARCRAAGESARARRREGHRRPGHCPALLPTRPSAARTEAGRGEATGHARCVPGGAQKSPPDRGSAPPLPPSRSPLSLLPPPLAAQAQQATGPLLWPSPASPAGPSHLIPVCH